MAEWLLELFSEEIPARMQAGAARDLERLAREGLVRADLPFTLLRAFVGPRRLTLLVDGLPLAQSDRVVERRGPRAGAPEAAVAGFLRSTGLAREALAERDGVLFAVTTAPGRPVEAVIAELVAAIVRDFPWPKSMRWGSGALRWVRPLHRILCVLDGAVVPFEVGGVASGALTEGHRVMGAGHAFEARSFEAYRAGLARGFVVLDAGERKRTIEAAAAALAARRGLTVAADPGLLEEVAGMVEWPVAVMGEIDARFMDLPPEVIHTTMRTHQRYFALRDAAGLAPRFIAIANLETPDSGALIARGASRVLAARLGDARFFWDEDRRIPLDQRLRALERIVFHARLGTMRERADRLARLARRIAPLVGADPELAFQAGLLAKTDLASAMVGEFPELQGVMGGYHARLEGLEPALACAIAEQYRPQGPSDTAPTAPTSMAVALADKLDAIVGFFAIGEAPTGSRDPFALRRAALGVIRILVENRVRAGLGELIGLAGDVAGHDVGGVAEFFIDRLKVSLRDRGARADVVEAAFAQGDDDPTRLTARVAALETFLATAEGADLLDGARRATNILEAELKRSPRLVASPIRKTEPPEEAALFDALAALDTRLATALPAEDFAGAMAALAGLRAPIDRFFERVLVNADDQDERANRLGLLDHVRRSMAAVADFGYIQGSGA